MGIPPLRFTGISQFSQDFQLIVDRTLQIATLPARSLQNDQARILGQKSSLVDLRSSVAALASSLRSLDSIGNSRALAATSTQSSKVSVSLPDATRAQAGSFTISEVTSLAQRAIATSTTGQDSPTSGPVAGAGGALQLVVGSQIWDLTLAPGSDHLEGARDAINAAGAGVSASLIHANGKVFLSLSADQTGARAIELRTAPGDPASNLLAVTQPGLDAAFKLNGQPVTSSENYVEGVIPGAGLTLKALTSGDESILIEVASSRAPLAAALKSFVGAYNELNKKIGESSALAGQSLVNDLLGRLRQIGGQFGDGKITSLAEIGIELDRQGVMSFQDAAFNAVPSWRMNDMFRFLRSADQGLASVAGRLEELSDPVGGAMAAQIRSWDESDSRIQKQIESIYERANATQSTLLARLQAADAMLARLEGQQSLLDASIKSLQFSMYGRQDS